MAVAVMLTVFWDVTPYYLVHMYPRLLFTETFCLLPSSVWIKVSRFIVVREVAGYFKMSVYVTWLHGIMSHKMVGWLHYVMSTQSD